MVIRPSLRQLRAFAEVSRAGSFSRAAETLFLSQSALSQSITQLEGLLGAPLFDRTTRSLQLSALGQSFLPRVEFILKELDTTLDQVSAMRDLESGSVAVGCLASIAVRLLPAVLAQFSALHPKIEVSVIDGNAADLRRRLLAGEIDVAITALTGNERDLAFEALMEDAFCLLCRRDHPLADKASVAWSELLVHRYIGFAPETGNRATIDAALANVGLHLSPLVELTQLGTVIGMVKAGYGVATIPALADPGEADLALLPLETPDVVRQVGLLTLAGRSQTFAASAFGRLLRERLRPVKSG